MTEIVFSFIANYLAIWNFPQPSYISVIQKIAN